MIFLCFSADTIPSFYLFIMSKADISDGQITYSIYPSDYLLNKLRVAIFAIQATERDSSRTNNKMKWQHKRGPPNTNLKKIMKILNLLSKIIVFILPEIEKFTIFKGRLKESLQ